MPCDATSGTFDYETRHEGNCARLENEYAFDPKNSRMLHFAWTYAASSQSHFRAPRTIEHIYPEVQCSWGHAVNVLEKPINELQGIS